MALVLPRHATHSPLAVTIQKETTGVFETPDGWVALISLGPRLLRCTSSDGLKFTTDGQILDFGGSVSDTVKVEGGWRTFFHVNASPRTGGKMLIRSAFETDGKAWKVEPGDRLVAPSTGPARLGVADPAPLQLADGTWLMAIKSFIADGRFGVPASAGQRFGEPGRRRLGDGPPPESLNRRDRVPPDSNRAESEFGAPAGSRRPPAGRAAPRFGWPWGVWTDGKKLAVVATHGSAVLIWNAIPSRDNQPPDLVLRPNDAGTPRNVTSDGATFFAVSDHNNRPANRAATMVWRSFPTSASQEPDFKWNEWLKGSLTADGGLIVAGMNSLFLWNRTPRDADTDADVVLRPRAYRNGDGPDAVLANGRLYVCNYNGNNLLVWNSLPTRDDQAPDFSLGSDTPEQDVWAENFFIQNGVVATDGRSLFISSDFDRKMFVWRQLPNESGATPDLVFHLSEPPWDNALHGQTLALAGKSTVVVWRQLPLNGEPPDLILSDNIGSVRLPVNSRALRSTTGISTWPIGKANQSTSGKGFPRASRSPNSPWPCAVPAP